RLLRRPRAARREPARRLPAARVGGCPQCGAAARVPARRAAAADARVPGARGRADPRRPGRPRGRLSASPLFTLAVPSSSVRTAAAIVGAPFDLTASFRRGSQDGPTAIRRLSESLETYSPELELDLEDIVVVDLGDVVAPSAGIDEALDAIAWAMGRALEQARVAVLFGGEHTVTLAGFRAVRRVH